MEPQNLIALPRKIRSQSLIRRESKRDWAIENRMRELIKKAPHLVDVRFSPLLRNFIHLTFILERSYARLENQDVLSPVSGELRTSIDVLRRLSETHMVMARELKLSPSVKLPDLMDLAAKIAAAKDEGNGG